MSIFKLFWEKYLKLIATGVTPKFRIVDMNKNSSDRFLGLVNIPTGFYVLLVGGVKKIILFQIYQLHIFILFTLILKIKYYINL